MTTEFKRRLYSDLRACAEDTPPMVFIHSDTDLSSHRAVMPMRSFSLDISSLDIADLNNPISKKAFGEIIQSPELFWQAFSAAFVQLGRKDELFSITVHGEALTISGREHGISTIKKCVEEIRKLVAKSHAEKVTDLLILPVKIDSSYFIEEQVDGVIDLRNWLARPFKIFTPWFRDFVLPVMPILCGLIGATYSAVVVSQQIRIERHIENQEIEALKISWDSGVRSSSL